MSPPPTTVSTPSSFHPGVAAQLFNARRVWKHAEYLAMAAQSEVPLHSYRSDLPHLKGVTPLAFILFQAVMTPTALRLRRLPAALRALASPDLWAGPPGLTEGGALLASHFASITDDYQGTEIMGTWRGKVEAHLAQQGVDWETAWREGACCVTRAREQRRHGMRTRWRRTDALDRWVKCLQGQAPVSAPSNLKDPEPEGCWRLMVEWWGQAKAWAAFPADYLSVLAPRLADQPDFRATLLERLRDWPVPVHSPMRTPHDVDVSLITTLEQIERHTGALTAQELTVVADVGLPTLTAWARHHQARVLPPAQSPRRRLRS